MDAPAENPAVAARRRLCLMLMTMALSMMIFSSLVTPETSSDESADSESGDTPVSPGVVSVLRHAGTSPARAFTAHQPVAAIILPFSRIFF